MCNDLIYWSAFDWQSFATLVTGLAAVAAAGWVGSRQAVILKRQTEIQETALRSSLFDRRYKVFECTKQFLREIIQHGDDPSPETFREFCGAMSESRFLFHSKVQEGLDEIWDKWSRLNTLNATKEDLHSGTQEGQSYPERQVQAVNWFSERFNTLPDLFDELNLG